ncbi:ABC transporter substrate-binding protein [Anaerolineales bacterium HSG25]|nr:ABC transporter substrate-binding protein [Anaerolineales bacterium HSG25]
MSQLKLYLFGSPRLELYGVPHEIERRKAMALLLYLAVTGQPHSRDALATLFWPDFDQRKAKASLRRTLSILNKPLADWLLINRETISLKQDESVWLDITQYQERLACYNQCESAPPSAEARREDLTYLTDAISLYHDDFLTGFTLPDCLEFDEWQFFQTEELRRNFATALAELVHGYRAIGDHETALTYARRWSSLDVLHEPVHLQLMELYALTGQSSAAIRQYRKYIQILQDELGAPPSAEITMRYKQIKARQYPPVAAPVSKSVNISTLRESALPLAPSQREGEQTSPPFLSAAENHPPSRVFVEREAELAYLQNHLDKAIAGHGRVIFVAGEVGNGKTALVRNFAHQQQQQHSDLLVLTGNCHAHAGLGDPYLPFRTILALLMGEVESKWRAGTITRDNAQRLWNFRQTAQTVVKQEGAHLLDSLIPRSIVGHFVDQVAVPVPPSNGHDGYLDQAHRTEQDDLFEQVTQVLQSLAQQKPILLIIDDAQWADMASISLLFHLGRQLAHSPILLLVTYRPDDVLLGRDEARHPLEPVVNELKRGYGDIQLDLGQATDYNFVEALLDSQPNQLGSEFRQALYQKTQGHPLFTVELLRTMRECGDMVQNQHQQWVEGETLNWQTLPARVEAVIEERIGRLDENLRDILTVASVEGEIFTAQVVAEVQETRERHMLRSLSQELEKRHHLVRERDELQVGNQFLSRYQFSHVLFQQHLYSTLSLGERRLLHGDVATILERMYTKHSERIVVQLAHHYSQAGQIEQAVEYLIQAGDQARRLYAYQEALDFYEQALAYLKEKGNYDQAARTLMKLGLTYHLNFDFPKSKHAYDEGFTLWQQRPKSQPASLPPAPHPLRIARTPPPTLDPTFVGDDISVMYIRQLFRGLVSSNDELDVVPEMAHSWEVLAEGSRYIFHLRDDYVWSDGVPVTAHDFVYAWRRKLDRRLKSANVSYLFDITGAESFYKGELTDFEAVGIKAPDPLTLVIELDGPTSYFPLLLAQAPMAPIPRHVVEQYGSCWTDLDKIVTNGSFIITEWQENERVLLSRNPAYPGQFAGNLEQVEIILGQKHRSVDRIEMYEANQLDQIGLYMPLAESKQMRRQRADEYLPGPMFNVQYIGFDCHREPFDDPRVRQALAYALDQHKLANIVLDGHAFPATGGFIPPNMLGHSADIGLPYDPDRARKLLAKAGYPEGRGFPKVDGLIRLGHNQMENYVKQQWYDILNITLEWEQLEWGTFLKQLYRTSKHIFRNGWVADYPDPDNMLRVCSHSLWSNLEKYKTYQILLEQARRSANQLERTDFYQQADRLLVEDAIVIPLLYGRRHMLVKPWLRKSPVNAVNWHLWKYVILEPH